MNCRDPLTAPFAPSAATLRPLRVALVDDHAVVRTGYRRLLELETDLAVVAEYDNGETAYHGVIASPVDVLVIDLSMPGRGGLDTVQRLRARGWPGAILVCSMHESGDIVRQALQAGANGYVTKSSPPEMLVTAVRQVAEGRQILSPDVADHAHPATGDIDNVIDRLSPREFEIFRRLAAGEEVPDIARALCLSEKTVFNYQTSIRQKAGFGSTLDMHRYASRRGLLSA